MKSNLFLHIVVDVMLVAVIVCVASVSFLGATANVFSNNDSAPIYRGNSDDKVALMINVYWGTEYLDGFLEIFKRYDVKCTFFVGGCWADDNVECLRDIYTAGHEIGNHGYFHKDQDKLDFTQNRKEIADCNRFIELAIGEKPTLFAPPSGAYNEHTLSAAKLLDMKTVLWSKDTIDWRDKDEKLIYSRATKGVKNGDFILMHPMPATANALDDILIYYENNGLKPITVSENL